MTDKGEKLSERLTKVHKNIEDTRRLIAYHKKMLKIFLRKEAEISDKLEKEQLNDLFRTVKDKGCDISAINAAIEKGEFSAEPSPKDKETANGKSADAPTTADFYDSKSK